MKIRELWWVISLLLSSIASISCNKMKRDLSGAGENKPVQKNEKNLSDEDAARYALGRMPQKYRIPNTVWHEQMNGHYCGPGAMEMVLDYWGPDIDQKPIANVARSSSNGTWSPDLVRTGHFSSMSAAQGSAFKNDIPQSGFAERPLGYGAFAYSSDSYWFEQMKATLIKDIPVIVLVTYEPEGGGGHYRVVIGWDDVEGVVYLLDPWGRDQKHRSPEPGLALWSYADFQSSWNYKAEGNDHPYWAVMYAPWEVKLQLSQPAQLGGDAKLNASIEYRCNAPFDCMSYPASDAALELKVPEGISLSNGSYIRPLGTLVGGQSAQNTWSLHFGVNPTGLSVIVNASGKISGSVPEARWTGDNVVYPPYQYQDQIGGSATLTF